MESGLDAISVPPLASKRRLIILDLNIITNPALPNDNI